MIGHDVIDALPRGLEDSKVDGVVVNDDSVVDRVLTLLWYIKFE